MPALCAEWCGTAQDCQSLLLTVTYTSRGTEPEFTGNSEFTGGRWDIELHRVPEPKARSVGAKVSPETNILLCVNYTFFKKGLGHEVGTLSPFRMMQLQC